MPDVTLVFPGDINTLTGGYRYDKRIVEGLRAICTHDDAWCVSLISLEGTFPFPNTTHLQNAAEKFADIADDTLVVIDGLAFGVMPEIIAKHANRLQMVALIHHPLALETGLSVEQSRHLQAMEMRALQHARQIITTSELTASSLAQYQIPRHKISAVLPGTDQSPLAQGSTTDRMNLLCVATLTQRKGHKILLDALSTIRHLPWQLSCVGSTERDKNTHLALLEQCKNLELQDKISFMGEVDEAALLHHYCQADLFVLASFHEGYGMVLSEAIARGLPIISSDAGAISQTVPDGAGLLVPPGDVNALAKALGCFMKDAQLRSRMRDAAMSARKQLRSWGQAAQEFSTVLVKIQTNEN